MNVRLLTRAADRERDPAMRYPRIRKIDTSYSDQARKPSGRKDLA